MTAFVQTVYIPIALFLTFMILHNVLCNDVVVSDEVNTFTEENNILVLNYCGSEKVAVSGKLENENEQSVLVPKIAMTDYVPREFRWKKIENLQCSEIKHEMFFVSFDAKEISDGADFYNINGTGTIISTESSYNLIYDSEEPENNNVSVLKKTNRLDNLLTPKGMLKAGNEYFYPDEFCIERLNKTGLLMKTCKIDCRNKDTPCLNMCCPLGEAFDIGLGSCHYSGEIEWRPILFSASNVHQKLKYDKSYPRVHYQRALLNCSEPFYIQSYVFREIPHNPYVPVKILSDGTAKFVGPARRWENIEYDHCATGMQNFSNESSLYTGAYQDQLIFICAPGYQESRDLSPYYVGAMLTAAVFLLLTAIIYILLWEKQNIHGWTILSFVTSLFFMFIFLSVAHLLGQFGAGLHYRTFYCVATGALAHFFFLSTFCWLSIINFDVWWTLRCNTALSVRSKGMKRFGIYILFSWGCPIIVISVGFALQHYFPDRESLVMVPDYAIFTCFVSKYAQGVYIYYIVGVLMIWNFIFMSLTFFMLYRFRQGTMNVRSASTHQQNSFRTLIKLVVVMGVTWCFEVISWQDSGTEHPWYWFLIDMVNVFQAIGIFIIFVCKKQIINQLQIKYPICRRGGLRPSGSQHTTSTNTRMSIRTDTEVNSIKIKNKLPKQFSQKNVLVGTNI